MSPWANFYEGREGHEYREYVSKRYATYIEAIRQRIRTNDLVMEIGCGTGTITSLLADRECGQARYVATDIDYQMVEITKKRMKTLGLDDVGVYQRDALDWKHGTLADVVHSHGMLEHFSDDRIRYVIERFRKHAHTQVHYVPGRYPAPTFGDERLMSVSAWWKICKPSQIITFNDGLDYALVFE